MVRVYAIASAKGGVGKTTTTANLGATLAGTGADVVVIDGDIGMANLGAALGVRPHGATLHDALSGNVEPVAAAYDGPAGLTVVPGDTSLEAFSAADPQQLQGVVDAFDDADFVLIDVGAGVSHETSVPLSVADAVVLVSTPERDALVDTEKTRQLTDRLSGSVAGAVLTRTDEATPVEEIVSGTLTADVLTTIPEDEAVRESIAVGEPLVSYAPHSAAAAAYRQLVTELTGLEPSAPEPAPAEVPDSEPPTDTAEPAETGHQPTSAHESADADHQPGSDVDAGVTIDAGDDSTDEPAEPTATASDSDDEHNVVNPFAADPETDPDPQPQGAESKWAEAATGTGGDGIEIDTNVGRQPDDDSTDGVAIRPEADDEPSDAADPEAPADGVEIPPETDASDERDSVDADESVPRDAIPFGSREPDDADDAESAQTTVLGTALDEENADGADETPADDDEPLIPDAEETAAAEAGTAADEPDDGGDDEEEKEEKRGFFSRLFR